MTFETKHEKNKWVFICLMITFVSWVIFYKLLNMFNPGETINDPLQWVILIALLFFLILGAVSLPSIFFVVISSEVEE